MNNLGWSEQKSRHVENQFKALYKVSIDWVDAKLAQATHDGYVTLAWGLRLRTPYLAKTVWGSPRIPYGAQAEGRTAGNALGQSYCMLNNRAGIEVQQKTLASPYRYDILPVAHIHDAQYFLVRDDIDALVFLNDTLSTAMKWQELPEIQHDQVGLGGELDIYYPTWASATTLPNYCTKEQIFDLCDAATK